MNQPWRENLRGSILYPRVGKGGHRPSQVADSESSWQRAVVLRVTRGMKLGDREKGTSHDVFVFLMPLVKIDEVGMMEPA